MVSSITNNLGFGVSKYYEDNRNLIVGVSNYFGNANVSSFEYVNDALGRRSERYDFDANLFAITNTFSYNQHQEIDEVTMGTNEYSFIYDNLGNREEFQIDDTSVDYIISQLNQYSETYSSNPTYDQNFQFDHDGNMTEIITWTTPWDIWRYTWNGENRMISATNTSDGTYITYDYDFQGRMVRKVTAGVTNNFVWNGNHIIAEISDSATNYYTWANGETLTASLDGETVFYCHDANKNVTDLVDTSGDSIAHYEYSPFGVIMEQSGTLAGDNPFVFSNEYFDETTGQVEFWQRKYLPQLGKFMSRDPIGVQGGINEYGICGNDLINKFDLWGLKEYDFSIYLGVGIAGNNKVIAKVAQFVREKKKTYRAPKGAKNDCRLTIIDRVTSDALREASKEYDVIHFFGHGTPDNKIDPDNKNRWIKRTKLGFSDGNIHLADVFTLESGLVKTEYMVPWVCFDKNVDRENKSNIPIYPPANQDKANLSEMFYRSLVRRISNELVSKKCCEVD